MTTAVTAARVEVLTAEVRVLMVGSRQVTLSVHAQLDQVKPGQVEPFGRVAPRDADPDYVYVVGVSTRDADRGSLVRSRYWTAVQWRRQAKECRRVMPFARERDALKRELADPANYSRQWSLQDQIRQLDNSMLGFHGWTAAELDETVRESAEEAGRAAQWEALPLIVLAGLR
jgi:hypothetical protein